MREINNPRYWDLERERELSPTKCQELEHHVGMAAKDHPFHALIVDTGPADVVIDVIASRAYVDKTMDKMDRHVKYVTNGHADVQHMAEERMATPPNLESMVVEDLQRADHVLTVSGTHACVQVDRRCAPDAVAFHADADAAIATDIHVSANQLIEEHSLVQDVLKHHAYVQTIRANGSPMLELSKAHLHGIKEVKDTKVEGTKDIP